MALNFGKNQLDRGHPLTVFLNDRAVFVASQANAGKFAEQHKAIGDLATKGATFIACPFCMTHCGIKEADLLPSIKLGHPDLTGGALSKDNTKTMTW